MTSTIYLNRDGDNEAVKSSTEVRQSEPNEFVVKFVESGHGYDKEHKWYFVNNEVLAWLNTTQLIALRDQISEILAATREKELETSLESSGN